MRTQTEATWEVVWQTKLTDGKLLALRKLVPKEFAWIGLQKGWEKTNLPFQSQIVDLTLEDLKTHLWMSGSTGAGKSTAIQLLMGQAIRFGRSIVVIDMRGEVVRSALELATGRVDPSLVQLFDLREIEHPTTGFNPLAGKGEPYFRALTVIDALESQFELGVQVRDTFLNLLMALAEAKATLVDIERMFFDAPFRASVVAKSTSESVIGFWERYGDLSPEKQLTLAQPCINKVSLLVTPKALRRTFGHSQPVDLGKHLNTPGSVTLVSLAADQLAGASRLFGNIFLGSLKREIFARISIPESQRNNVTLFVDEFETFNQKEFESILSEGRKYRIQGIFANQVLAQLSPTMRSLILNNVGAKFVFRTGRDDSTALSRDITGDPKAMDFTTLPTGEAYLWRKNKPLVHVVLNEPLIKNPGSLSGEAERYVESIRALIPKSVEDHSIAPPLREETNNSKVRATLEDWL